MADSNTRRTTPALAALRAQLPRKAIAPLDLAAVVGHLAMDLREITGTKTDRLPTTAIATLPCLRVCDTTLPVAGYTFWDCHRHQWVIHLNTNESPEDRRFTLLHEFGHIAWHGHGDQLFAGLSPEQRTSIAERAADIFAGEALMPTSRVLDTLRAARISPEALAHRFGVSPSTALWRLDQIGLPHPHDLPHIHEPSVHPRSTPLMEDAA